MKKINILESLLAIDKKSSNRYELATLYEACKLKDEDKYQLVKYIDSYEHPSLIGEFLKSKCDGICESVCDDDDVDGIKLIDDINTTEAPAVSTFDLLDMIDDECENTLNESIVNDDSKSVRKYVWNKIQTFDSLTDDDSYYWDFDQDVRDGLAAKLVTDELDIPDNAHYKFSLPEADLNFFFVDNPEYCYFVIDKNYEAPAMEESKSIKEDVEINKDWVLRTPSEDFTDLDESSDNSSNSLISSIIAELKKYVSFRGTLRATDKGVRHVSTEDDFASYISRTTFDKYINDCLAEGKDIEEIEDNIPWEETIGVHHYFEVDEYMSKKRRLDIKYGFSKQKAAKEESIEEDLEKDLERRYTISKAHTDKSVLRNIEELAGSEYVKEINPVVKYDTQMFEMISADGRVFYLVPSTMSQFDVYDADENLITKSEFAKYIVDEVLSDKSNLEFVYQIVGGGFSGIYSREEIEALPCFSGNYTDDQSDIRANGGFTSREELDNQPKLDGYVGPMMDGWRNHKMVLRYETQEIYNQLSEDFEKVFDKNGNEIEPPHGRCECGRALIAGEDEEPHCSHCDRQSYDDDYYMLDESVGIESNWNDYCPHCTNRSLQITDEHSDIARCDSCGQEYQIVPMANGKVKIVDLDEGFLDDVKKVGKTVKDVAKDRWNDSYTKAIATGVKKNLSNTRLAKDLKRIGDSVKDTDTYKKVTGEVTKLKSTVKDMKRDNNRKPEEISFNVRGKSYRASDLEYKLNGKAISPEEVAKMGSLERKNIEMIVPRGTKPVKEEFGYNDDEAFTKEEVIAQLKAQLPNLGNDGIVRYGFISEAEVARDFLSKYYALAELDSVGSWFQIDYADPFKNEEVIQMTANEMKDRFGTDNPDIINCGRPEEDGTIELKKV